VDVICRSALALAAILTTLPARPLSLGSEWEDKTASERKTRQEAAVKKEAEMRAAGANAISEHRAQREKAAAETLAANKAAEQAEAAEMANETNPWNTICTRPHLQHTRACSVGNRTARTLAASCSSFGTARSG
jgi:hypothetical protein